MRSIKNHMPIIALMCVIYIYSGSLFYMSANMNLQLIIIPIVGLLIVVFNKRGEWRIFTKIQDKYCIGFLYILAISIVCNLLVMSPVSQFILYFTYEFLIFLCAYLIVICVSYDMFKKYFINTLTALALVSLVCWIMPEVIQRISIMDYTRGNWSYASILVYNLNLRVPQRNCGPFWEPGLYQAYLNFALLLIATDEKRKGNIFRTVILAAAVITTFSSTGYFLLGCVVLIKIYQSKMGAKRILLSILVIFVGYIAIENIQSLLMFIDQFTLYSISEKFAKSDSESVVTRLYSGICDLRISLTNPFGVNRAELNELREKYIREYGNITASTNTITVLLTYFGWIPGLLYFLLWIRGCIRQQKRAINKLILLVFMASILLTELHVDLLFFNIILFYWNSIYAFGIKDPPKNVVSME